MPWSRRTLLATAAPVGAAGCSALSEPGGSSGTPALSPSTATDAYTHLQASGNRAVPGSGSVRGARPVDTDVRGTPAWLLAIGGSESRWVVVTAGGTPEVAVVRKPHVDRTVGFYGLAVGAGTEEAVRVWQG